MKTKGSSRKTLVPVDYIISDPHGNRASRRMAAKEAKAAARGRRTGASTGAASQPPSYPPSSSRATTDPESTLSAQSPGQLGG